MKRFQALPPVLLCASFFLLLTVGKISAADSSNSTSIDILLNCGYSGSANDTDDRTWTGDADSKYAPSINGLGIHNLSPQDSSAPPIPYSTARVFTSYTYTFPLAPGWKFIRLYFYPSNYSSHAASDAFFSVTTRSKTLLHNFSASLTADSLNFSYLILEYSINVNIPSSGLNLTFIPSTDHPNSYAFVNGIEIVSIPNIFVNPSGALLVGTN